MTDETPDLSDLPLRSDVEMRRDGIAILLDNLPFTGELDNAPFFDPEHGEAEYLDKLGDWLHEFEGALQSQQMAASEMLVELQTLRAQRRVVREFFGTA